MAGTHFATSTFAFFSRNFAVSSTYAFESNDALLENWFFFSLMAEKAVKQHEVIDLS